MPRIAPAVTYLLLFPIFGSLFLLWGIGSWLVYKTARPFRWLEGVLKAIGPPTAGESAGGKLEA